MNNTGNWYTQLILLFILFFIIYFLAIFIYLFIYIFNYLSSFSREWYFFRFIVETLLEGNLIQLSSEVAPSKLNKVLFCVMSYIGEGKSRDCGLTCCIYMNINGILVRQRGCAKWSKCWLCAHFRKYVFWHVGSFSHTFASTLRISCINVMYLLGCFTAHW